MIFYAVLQEYQSFSFLTKILIVEQQEMNILWQKQELHMNDKAAGFINQMDRT